MDLHQRNNYQIQESLLTADYQTYPLLKEMNILMVKTYSIKLLVPQTLTYSLLSRTEIVPIKIE